MTLNTGRFRTWWLLASLASFAAGCECGVPIGSGGGDGGADARRVALRTDECGNGIDDDGNGRIDDGCPCGPGETQSCYSGLVASRNVGACADGVQTCRAPGAEWGDWGNAPCEGGTLPAAEQCDGMDHDCDGARDEGCPCTSGATRECGAEFLLSPCTGGTQTCSSSGVWSACEGAIAPTPDVCDGLDNDCDGVADTGCGCEPEPEVCADGRDNDCDREVDEIECTPNWLRDAGVLQSDACMAEICGNGMDDDCDGSIDDGCSACSASTGSPLALARATPMSAAGAPSSRIFGSRGVVDGCRVIYWGGRDFENDGLQSGGIYDVASDSWRPTSLVGAPRERNTHWVGWNGRFLFVWGGQDQTDSRTTVDLLTDGGLYDPATDSWIAIRPAEDDGVVPRRPSSLLGLAPWTGREFVIPGGGVPGTTVRTRDWWFFNPDTLAWRRFAAIGPNIDVQIASSRAGVVYAVGHESAGPPPARRSVLHAYDEVSGTWTRMPDPPAIPSSGALGWDRSVATDMGIVLHGGDFGDGVAVFDYVSRSWTVHSVSHIGGSGRSQLYATGASTVLAVATEVSGPSAAVFDLSSNAWTPLALPHPADPAHGAWVGDRMVFWEPAGFRGGGTVWSP